MASPKTIAMNDNIPKPTMLLVKEGKPNTLKTMQRDHKRARRGKTFLDMTRTKGAFGNKPIKSFPFGYDGIFPKKVKISV